MCMESRHGGDIYHKNVQLDFSSNINPLGIPESVRSALQSAVEVCDRYPDIFCASLRSSIAEMEGCPPEWIVCGNGASELFPAVIHALHPRHTLIPVPSFYGYERAASAVEGKLSFFVMEEREGFQLSERFLEELTSKVDLVFLASPNNPVGRRIPDELMEKVLHRCSRNGITVVLDECFNGFVQKEQCMCQCSLKERLMQYPNLLIVRAFTKLYAMPGVRLGYLISSKTSVREAVNQQLAEWNLSSFAQAAGIAACKEREYRERTPEYVKGEREYLTEGLHSISRETNMELVVYPAEANYLLLKSADPLYEPLLRKGILIRDCRNFRGLGTGYYRIAVRTRQENERLLRAIAEIAGEMCREGV